MLRLPAPSLQPTIDSRSYASGKRSIRNLTQRRKGAEDEDRKNMPGTQLLNPPFSAPLRLCVSFSCLELLASIAFIALTSGCQSLKPDWSKNWFSSPRVQESKYSVP